MADQERTGEDAADRQGDEAEAMARLQEEIGNLPVSEHLVYMMHSLSALAVGRLGLTADTSAPRDLGQARLAIDAFRALLTLLEQARPAADIAAHRGMLSQLQLAYAGAIEGGSAAEKPEATADRPAAAAATPEPVAVKPTGAAETPEGASGRPDAPPESTEAPRASEETPAASGGAAPKKAAAPRKAQKPRRSSQTGS